MTTPIHPELTMARWRPRSLRRQMGRTGSGVSRTRKWRTRDPAARGAMVLLFALCALYPFLPAGVFAGALSPSPSRPAKGQATPALDGILAPDLMRTVGWLASPESRGRLAGSAEYEGAVRVVAERFRRWGLRPGGDGALIDGALGVEHAAADSVAQAGSHGADRAGWENSPLEAYLQAFTIEYNRIDRCELAIIEQGGKVSRLELGRDFACRGLTGSAAVTATVVFVGYGLSRPEIGYDDYAGIDVRGKIALAFKEAPPFEADSSGWGEVWMPRPKGAIAAAHGAVALLLVSRPNQEHPQHPIGSMLEGNAEHDGGFPRLQVSVEVGDRLVRSSGLALAGLESAIDSTRAPASQALSVMARVEVRAAYDPERPSNNVIGWIEGSDPALKDEFVIVGAHLDHVGSQGEVHYPGANDNASGAAAVLAIAEACATTDRRPRRSIAFGLWSSEEAGLLGSRHFVNHAPMPRERIVAYLNFDCVGHGDSIEVGGGETYPGLWETARGVDREGARLMVGQTWGGGGADAAPFEEAGIPNLYFASSFSYTHLHVPSDTPATLNPALLEAVARLGCGTAWRIAQAGAEPGVKAQPPPAGETEE